MTTETVSPSAWDALSVDHVVEVADALMISYTEKLAWFDQALRYQWDTGAAEQSMTSVLDVVDLLPGFAQEHFNFALAQRIAWQNEDAS